MWESGLGSELGENDIVERVVEELNGGSEKVWTDMKDEQLSGKR